MLINNAKPLYPVPEAIERKDVEGAFDIEEGYTSTTDFSKAKMVVPTGGVCIECGEDHARAARLMEMGHIAWSPSDLERRVKRTKDGLPLSLVERCEEARINGRRKVGGLEPMPPRLCDKDSDYYFAIRQFVRSGDMVGLSGLVASAFGTGDDKPLGEAIKRVINEMSRKNDETEQLRALTIQMIYDRVRSHTQYHMFYTKTTFRYSLSLARDILSIVSGAVSDLEKKLEEANLAKQVKVKEYAKGKPKDEGKDPFGKMNIVELPMPYRSKAGFERRWTARDEGDIPTRFDRWSIDKRIFRSKKRSKGAAVLVDVSGSMSWTEDDLTRVLDEVPAATIAIYSGNGNEGKLVIVAKNGRCASMRQAARYMMGGNVIDGPALEWLAEQKQTVKLWMSDGGITGRNDRLIEAEKVAQTADRIIRRGDIQQVRNSDAVVEILTGKRPFVPSKKVQRLGWY